jgi:putative ABC transport system permease protein
MLVEVEGSSDPRKRSANLRFVDTEYFHTLRIPLISGRSPEQTDMPGRPEIAVVNQAFASSFLPPGRAVGSLLRLGWGGDAPKRVVGIVGDIRHGALDSGAAPEVYVPLAQFPVNDLAVVIRAAGDPGSLAGTIREAVREMDSGVPVENVRTLDDYLLLSAAPQRFLMWVLNGFAGSTVPLSLVGLYGALSYSTACRRHEFGVRLALGSSAWGVKRLVLSEGLGIACAGILVGLTIAASTAHFLSSWLYGTSALDPLSLACAALALLVIAAAASWAPAQHAAQVSPITSLRGE